jgi:hypothetical protein
MLEIAAIAMTGYHQLALTICRYPMAARGGVQAVPASSARAVPDPTPLRPRHDAYQGTAMSPPRAGETMVPLKGAARVACASMETQTELALLQAQKPGGYLSVRVDAAPAQSCFTISSSGAFAIWQQGFRGYATCECRMR